MLRIVNVGLYEEPSAPWASWKTLVNEFGRGHEIVYVGGGAANVRPIAFWVRDLRSVEAPSAIVSETQLLADFPDARRVQDVAVS